MVQRQQILVARRRSLHSTQLLLAGLAALLALTGPLVRWSAVGGDFAAEAIDGIAFAGLCAAIVALAQSYVWPWTFKAALPADPGVDAGAPTAHSG